MSGEEDDKATVVIDINALKREKEKKEKEMADMASDLEFAVEPQAQSQPLKRSSAPASDKVPVLFFEFGGNTFAQDKSLLPTGIDAKIVKDLPTLNDWLKKKTPLVVVFAFDVNPKAVNQLCAQLKAKFSHVKTVLVAKSLSPDKVRLHQSSPAGANGYVKYPFTQQSLQQALAPLLVKKAG